MKMKSIAKQIIDVAMLLLVPILAAELQLGQESHEWLGIAMFGLFILHHILNYKWFAGVFRGEYQPVRAFVTMLNLLLLLVFIALAISIFGIYSFVDLKIANYLFLQTHFMFYDETKSLGLYFVEVVSVLVLFGTIGHYLVRLLKKLRPKAVGKRILKIVSFVIPLLICVVVIVALNHGGGKGYQNQWGKKQAANGSSDRALQQFRSLHRIP